jgi:hypothetical protein
MSEALQTEMLVTRECPPAAKQVPIAAYFAVIAKIPFLMRFDQNAPGDDGKWSWGKRTGVGK